MLHTLFNSNCDLDLHLLYVMLNNSFKVINHKVNINQTKE